MELQAGKEAPHDFLSLYTKDSSMQRPDPRPPSQGFFLKTHDFLQPLEERSEMREDVAKAGPAEAGEHVLPGGIGTFSISHVSDPGSRAAVKPERFTCPVVLGFSAGSKPEPDNGNGGFTPAGGAAPFALWGDSGYKGAGQWPSSFAARGSASGSLGSVSSASRHQPPPERKRFMEAASRSSRGFDDEDEDDEEFAKREGSSSRKELTVKVDGKGSGSGNDQRPNTPRSKHSATEQRRRSKINDRFQILRELIPNSDQKRDKASFLLEVIEYVRFLQEKVQKHESSYPEGNQDNAKLLPWVNVYFRSFWKNSRNNSQIQGDIISYPSQVIKNGSVPTGYMSSGKFNDNHIPVAPVIASGTENPTETDLMVGVSCRPTEAPTNLANKAVGVPAILQPNLYASVGRGNSLSQSQQRFLTDVDNVASQSQAPWLRLPVPASCAVSSGRLNVQDELIIDEGTINLSSQYSQELLTALSQALQNSGIDLSQASVSVQINLGKRAASKRTAATGTTCSPEDLEDPVSTNQAIGQSRVGSSCEESLQAPKRHRGVNS
ncbi:transcription factor BIM1-like isoform X2 [Typha angustifolia]|uniref:transcription factor BIM1-like isoform X2 n=1 Tax=Typha angustifolia TaxID=59011 RepID=UPI003C2F2B19